MKRIRKRFARNDQNAKDKLIGRQANDLLDSLVAAGAQFYYYCAQSIMYLQGQVVDLRNRKDVLSALKQRLNNFAYARDTVERLPYRARPFFQLFPEGTLGTINGVKEPEPKMTTFLRKSVRGWLKEAIESGKLSPTNGEENEDERLWTVLPIGKQPVRDDLAGTRQPWPGLDRVQGQRCCPQARTSLL